MNNPAQNLASASLFPKSKAQLNRERYATEAEQKRVDLKAQRSRRRESRRPAWGSQEWAETRGDDIGPSPDF